MWLIDRLTCLGLAWSGWLAQLVGRWLRASWCASTAADRPATKCESDTAPSRGAAAQQPSFVTGSPSRQRLVA
jgi:hypothetical protein